MDFLETIIFVFYVLVCVGLSWYLRQRYKAFKIYKGFLILFVIGVMAVLLHNMIYAVWKIEEAFFFLLSLLALGSFVCSFILWLYFKTASSFKKK